MFGADEDSATGVALFNRNAVVEITREGPFPTELAVAPFRAQRINGNSGQMPRGGWKIEVV